VASNGGREPRAGVARRNEAVALAERSPDWRSSSRSGAQEQATRDKEESTECGRS